MSRSTNDIFESDKENLDIQIRFAIRSALAESAHETGLQAGDVSERLIEGIVRELFEGPLAWATKRRAAWI